MTAREACGMRHEAWDKSHECLLTAAIEEGDTRRGRGRPPSGAAPFAQAHAACGTCAQASHSQLKNNSFQLKSIKRNYFTLNQLRLAQESPRVAHEKKQNFYSALRFWETDWRQTTAERQQRARRRKAEEQAREGERESDHFKKNLPRMLIIMIYGPSWGTTTQHTSGRDTSGRVLEALLYSGSEPTNWFDCRVLKCWQSATWDESKDRRRSRRSWRRSRGRRALWVPHINRVSSLLLS